MDDIIKKHNQEVEVVKPEVLVKWRTFLPEKTIWELITQRRYVVKQRQLEERITVSNFKYKMPRMPEAEKNPKALALAIMSDGSIRPKTFKGSDRIGRIDRVLYKYETYAPRVTYKVTDLPLATIVANMMFTGITPLKPEKARRRPFFYTEAVTARAVRAVILMQPHMVGRWALNADYILKTYREKPSIPYRRG